MDTYMYTLSKPEIFAIVKKSLLRKNLYWEDAEIINKRLKIYIKEWKLTEININLKNRRVNSTCHKVSTFINSFQIILSNLLPTLCREPLRKWWQDLCEQVAHFMIKDCTTSQFTGFNCKKNINNKRSHSLTPLWPSNEKDKEMKKERQGREWASAFEVSDPTFS